MNAQLNPNRYNLRTTTGQLLSLDYDAVIALIQSGYVKADDMIQNIDEKLWQELRHSEFASYLTPAMAPVDTASLTGPAFAPSGALGVARPVTAQYRPQPQYEGAWDRENLVNWLLALSPLIAFGVRAFLMAMEVASASGTMAGNADPAVGFAYVVTQHAYWWVTPALSIGLAYLNLHFLASKVTVERKSLRRWAVLVPVFLYKRATLLNVPKLTFWVWVSLYVVSVIGWALIGIGAEHMVAADQASGNLGIFGN